MFLVHYLSDSIVFGYELLINPFGNVTAGDDELFPGSEMEIFLDAEFPLEFGANQLALTDTFNIDYSSNENYTPGDAQITLWYNNGFPLGAELSLFLLDENGALIESILGDSPINNGMYNAGTFQTTATIGEVIFNLTESNIVSLESASQMSLIVSFTTDSGQLIKIDANAFFDFKLRSNLQISLHL